MGYSFYTDLVLINLNSKDVRNAILSVATSVLT